MKILSNRKRKEIASVAVNIYDLVYPKLGDERTKETVKYGTLHVLQTLFGVKGTRKFLKKIKEENERRF